MRSRYRMFRNPTWQEIDRESAATIDCAIRRACELSGEHGPVAVVDHSVAVHDSAGKYGGARGVAERGKWRWVKPCKCKDGRACDGRGWRVAIE